MSPALERLKATLAAGGPHLGDLTFWTLADAAIDRSSLESRWTAANLPADLLPEKPTAERTLKLAVKTCSPGHADQLIRLAVEDESSLVFGIVREQRSTEGRLSYTQEARVSLNKVTAIVTADDPHHDLAQALLKSYRSLIDVHSTADLARTIVKTLHRFSAVTLRESGGVYWVPRTSAESLRRLQSCIEGIGASKFHVLPVHESREGNQVLGAVAKASLEQELADLQVEIAAFKAEPPKRTSTISNRLEAFEALRARAELYRSILAVNLDGLDIGLAELATEVEQMLGSKAA